MLLVSFIYFACPTLSHNQQEHVPFEADMAVPPSLDLPVVCASPEFVAFVERVKREFQVTITPNLKPPAPIHSTNGSSTSLDHPSTSSPQMAQMQSQGEYSFKFACQRSNSDFLLAAREMLEQFLLNHNVRVYPSPTAHTHKRGDSFAEAFPHFDSKVLSTARRHGELFPYRFLIRWLFACTTISIRTGDSLINFNRVGRVDAVVGAPR